MAKQFRRVGLCRPRTVQWTIHRAVERFRDGDSRALRTCVSGFRAGERMMRFRSWEAAALQAFAEGYRMGLFPSFRITSLRSRPTAFVPGRGWQQCQVQVRIEDVPGVYYAFLMNRDGSTWRVGPIELYEACAGPQQGPIRLVASTAA